MAFDFNWKPQDLSYQQYQFLSNPDEAFKNKANTKLAQEMLGFEGKDIDGAAGKATRNAYNKQMRYYNDLYGTVSKAGSLDLNDPTAFYNDIHDAEAYSFSPQEAENELNADIQAEEKQAEETQRQSRIAEIESQIKEIESRIATNTAKLQNFTGNADQIAALEARKINTQDPTSIWRWKEGVNQQRINRQQDLDRIEKEKAKAKEEQKQFIRNKISSTLPTMSIGWNTSPEQIQQFKNTLAGLKTEAMNNKLSDQYNALLDAEAQLNGQLPQQKAQMAMDAMANATNLFNVTKEEGGFGKDPKAYHDYLLQQYTQITRDFPEAKYDPAFNKAFRDADKLHRKTVKTKKVRPSGRS